jgi:hypothetical protein
MNNKIHKETDLGYAAGIIDGEGCILITTTGYATAPNCLRVEVFMKDGQVVDWLHANFGGRNYKRRNDYGPTHQWMLYGEEAGTFLGLIKPYMILKAPHASIAEAFCKTLGSKKANSLDEKTLMLRLRLSDLLKELNKRQTKVGVTVEVTE